MRFNATLITLLLIPSLLLNIWLRLLPLSSLKGDLLLGTDPARYTRLARIISEKGKLPERDVMRSAPLGKETKYQLTFFPYLMAYLYRAIKPFAPEVTIQKVAIILPPILSTAALLMLFVIARKLFDVYTALLSVNIASVSPPLVGRTLAGFADKDGLALLLGLIAFYFFIGSFREEHLFKRIVLSLAFGFSMMLLGLTWQGVGVFLAVPIITEFMMLLLDGCDLKGFILAFCRYSPVLIGLIAPKAVYRDLSQPFVILAIGLPLLLLLLSLFRLIVNRFRMVSEIFSLRGHISETLPLSVIMLTFVVILSWDKIPIFVENFLSTFGSNRLAQSIQELQKQGASGWAFYPGAFFLICCAGAVIAYKDVVSRLRMDITASLILFELLLMSVPFSRIFSGERPSGETWLTLSIYIGALIVFLMGMFLLLFLSTEKEPI